MLSGPAKGAEGTVWYVYRGNLFLKWTPGSHLDGFACVPASTTQLRNAPASSLAGAGKGGGLRGPASVAHPGGGAGSAWHAGLASRVLSTPHAAGGMTPRGDAAPGPRGGGRRDSIIGKIITGEREGRGWRDSIIGEIDTGEGWLGAATRARALSQCQAQP